MLRLPLLASGPRRGLWRGRPRREPRGCLPGGALRASAAQLRRASTLPVRESTGFALHSEDWDVDLVRRLLQQVAQDGQLEAETLQRLHGAAGLPGLAGEQPQEGEGGVEEGEPAEGGELTECGLVEFVLTAELCCARRFRDFVLMAALAGRLSPVLHGAPVETLRRVGTAFSALGVLNAPIFQAIAGALLDAWPAAREPPPVAELVQVARSFSVQRMRHEELFDRLAAHLRSHGAAAVAPAEALSLLHSHAFLRLRAELGDLWGALEAQAVSLGLAALGTKPLSELCYLLVLAREADTRPQDVCNILEALAPGVLELHDDFWRTGEGFALHQRLLLLRSVLRYLYKDAFRTVSNDVVSAFRRVHRLEPPKKTMKPMVSFTRKLSYVLTKMRIGHLTNAEKGAFTLDVVERDRKLVYECNHFDRYYVGSTDKIATMCLQERVVKAMGYRVVQVPHWQWNKIKHRRQRSEYLRMSRYYAIKDRREIAPRDEAPEDVAVNELDHLGEYFFRKEMPASSWSWFQPRYDARRRLPQTGAALTP